MPNETIWGEQEEEGYNKVTNAHTYRKAVQLNAEVSNRAQIETQFASCNPYRIRHEKSKSITPLSWEVHNVATKWSKLSASDKAAIVEWKKEVFAAEQELNPDP